MSQPSKTSRRVIVQNIEGAEEIFTGLSTTTTIRELKLKFCDRNPNLSVRDQTLYLANSDPPVILEDARTFESYGILNDARIHLVTSESGRAYANPEDGPKLDCLFIKDADGRTLTMRDVPLHMTVGAFFERFQKENGKSDDIRLMIFGKELRPESDTNKTFTLLDFGVVNESTLFLLYRVKGGL